VSICASLLNSDRVRSQWHCTASHEAGGDRVIPDQGRRVCVRLVPRQDWPGELEGRPLWYCTVSNTLWFGCIVAEDTNHFGCSILTI
jgi:hypothetical protein